MKKLESLTEDQEAILEQVKDDWIKFALLEGDEINEKQTRDGINWLYHISGLKQPITIIVDSPLAVQYGVNIARELLKSLKTPIKGNQVRNQVWNQVESQVGNQVWNQVESQVGNQVRSQVRNQVGNQVWSQVESQGLSFESFARDALAYWASWTARAEVFEKLGVVKHSDYKKYKRFMRSGVFMGVYLDGLAVVCRRPSAVHRDDQARLHYDQGPAIEWRDGYKLYYLHGQFIDEPLYNKIVSQKMTIKDVMDIGSADQRTMAISMLRPDRLLKHLNAKLISTGQKGTKLYEVPNFMDSGDTEYAMVMQDASSDRVFLEWTPPEIGKQKDADLCQAHAFGIPLEDYLLMEQEA